ncbi:MAG TPA: FAD-dependent oxidoreductase [Candidatus Acidoferrum sp.]|nr:FAD-dependent oxidoreductase [Candidatus Acidoferrum sp.]
MPTLFTSLQAKHRPSKPSRRKRDVTAGMKISPGHDNALEAGLDRIARSRPEKSKSQKKKAGTVAVVGAGLAGLCAAYQLMEANFEVEVFEARDRVGGRTHTLKGIVNKKCMDAGAELIGDNHPLWLHFADKFGVKLTDAKDYGNSPIRLGNRTLTWDESKKLNRRMEKLITKLTQAAEAIVDPFEPWLNPDARKLDCVSLAHWIRNAKAHPQAKKALQKMLEADGGVVAEKQSLLAVLAMIRGGGLDRFWNDSELHRCEGGSQTLAKAFAAKLKSKGAKLLLGTQVCGLSVTESGATVFYRQLARPTVGQDAKPITKCPADAKRHTFDFVVLAIPPTVWKTIPKIEPSQLNRLLGGATTPQMGANVKYLMPFDTRFWENAALGPNLTEDGLVDMTWETTEADPENDPQYGMVAFSGAKEAEALSSMTSAARKKHYIECLGPVYRGIEKMLGNAVFVNWPKTPWTLASYCFPAPGEVTKWGPVYKAGFLNRLHFAGEHTCYAYMGYMEGALSSGYRVAARIAVRNKIGM